MVDLYLLMIINLDFISFDIEIDTKKLTFLFLKEMMLHSIIYDFCFITTIFIH